MKKYVKDSYVIIVTLASLFPSYICLIELEVSAIVLALKVKNKIVNTKNIFFIFV